MIKKILLALALLAPVAAGAQVMEKFPGLQLNKISDNGRYIADATQGVCIYDRQSQQTYNYGSSFALGGGHAISNNGTAVGAMSNFSVPAIWQDGEWTALPNDVGASVSYGRADGITPNGKYIVGTMDCRPLTKKGWPMVSPVLWTLNEETGKYSFSLLPEPDKDITGCQPQQVSANYVSEDGKTILGQVTDFRGLLTYQIIYRLGEDGEWSYSLSGNNRLIKEGAEWPEYPIMPKKPQAADYLTQEEILAFNKANQAYKDSLEIVALTGKNPRMPFYEDFIKEKKEQFDEDMAKYEEDSSSYLEKLYAFQDAYKSNLTNDGFEFNSHVMSVNGLYHGANYIYTGTATADNPAPTYVSPIIYVNDGSIEERLIHDSSMTLFSVCDNGSILACTPTSDDYVVARTPYIISLGEDPILYKDWVEEKYPAVYNWMKENIVYDVNADESGTGQAEKDMMLCGSVRFNSDMTKSIAYYVEPGKNTYTSYVIDYTAEPSGIESKATEADFACYLIPGTKTLAFTEAPDLVEVYDASGRLLYKGTPGINLSLDNISSKGICIIKASLRNHTTAKKVVL